jgi:ArsR family metal-binding transcriptional regulator
MNKTILKLAPINQIVLQYDQFLIHIHYEAKVLSYEFKSRDIAIETFESIQEQLNQNSAIGDKNEFITIQNHL